MFLRRASLWVLSLHSVCPGIDPDQGGRHPRFSVENAWNSVLHKALQDAAAEGVIEYVLSEGVSGTDYPRAKREYAEQGAKLIIGETFPSKSRPVKWPWTIPRPPSSWGRAVSNRATISGSSNLELRWCLSRGDAGRQDDQDEHRRSVGAMPIPEVNMLINAFAAA